MAGDRLKKFRREPLGFAALCTAEGEFHAVGIRMLAELLRAEGWETDVVVPVSLPSLRVLGSRNKIGLICISSTIQSTGSGILKTVWKIRSEPLTKEAKILVGGPAFRAKEVRAMFEGQNAGSVDFIASNLKEAIAYSLSLKG
jgi:methanogenic corrinoid protein MtbC1